MKMKGMCLGILLLFSVGLFAPSVFAQEVIEGDASLKGLKGVYVLTEDVARFDPADNLSGEIITDSVESKLRDAGIKVLTKEQSLEEKGAPFLHVDIDYWKAKDGSLLANIVLKFEQEVVLERAPSIKLTAITWMDSQIIDKKTGEVGAEVIRELGSLVNRFISDYKSVNGTK